MSRHVNNSSRSDLPSWKVGFTASRIISPDQDWEDNAIESEMDQVLEGLGHAGNAEIEAIYSALARLNDGTYGVCARCGDDISEDRLDVVPYTPLCRSCAVRSRRSARTSHTPSRTKRAQSQPSAAHSFNVLVQSRSSCSRYGRAGVSPSAGRARGLKRLS